MKFICTLFLSFLTIISYSQSAFMKQGANKPIENRSVVAPIIASIGYQGYEETQEYFGEGEYEIFIDNVDGILDNPIIVLDGFDPGDGRDITGLYNSLSFGGQNMADILRDEGFDIVILNAPQYTTGGKDIDGGADYIQRNAMVLIELINLLNTQKVGDEELVVLGPSMGGLIARYGLAYMEQNSMDAETRLYISFDSPHLGANIPISLQYLINYLAQELGDADAVAIVDNVLNSPAAKEMLYDHLLGHLLSGSAYEQDPTLLLPIGAPNFRDAFQAELNTLGFPQNVRNVAMVNGSAQGTTTGTAGMQVVDTTLDLGSGLTADVILHFTPEAGTTNNATSFDSFFFGIPLDSFDADAEAFGFSDGVDSAPGGTANISAALGGGGSTNPVIVAFIAALDQDDYSFIPVISSLAIENEDDWFATPDIGGIHSSPFVNTYIPSENEPHVTVTAASAEFALNEIRNPVLGFGDFSIETRYFLAKNPASETIKIQLNPSFSYGEVTVEAYSVTGQNVFSLSEINPKETISIENTLETGIYFLNIRDAKGVYTLKLAVQ
ncbi:putative secreted protein (Por secretion system target) [Ulvibacter sp. MAR_2010_11]|uniref:T9SS type A sorting domain-containing protein n=1 Tax=Ulvibacter sp. MAR_2010_11 TaxID=1250229 RepID=UPI000C2BF608|nr:T9SS type A sorting domain-containing protein [Ulvibacter sp. MAR_2010_11]PKA84402.1 putative secreted protein (Por secretion system target) [Ulvibacter sp. MAR_2010_11]